MKQLFLLFLATFALAAGSKAQTADDIINKYLDAIGGKEKLAAINSVHMESTMQVMGNEAPSSSTVLKGKGFREESDFNGAKIINVVTDKGGWMVNPMAGATDPTALSDDQVKQSQEQIYVIPLLDYASRGNKAEYLGQEKLGDVNA